MGSRKQEQTQTTNQNVNQHQSQSSNEAFQQSQGGGSRVTFAPRTQAEAQLLGQFSHLGNEQIGFLNNLLSGTTSPFQLNEADRATLDKSFDASRDRFLLEGKDYADYLATTRGLNKSDTPVSGQAMQRFGMGLADLESARANAALNMGLQGTGMRLQGSQSLPAGLVAAFNPMFQERMAAPTTSFNSFNSGSSSSNFRGNAFGNSGGTTSTMQRMTPSLMDNIGQGMGLVSQGIGLGAQIGGMAMGIPMPGMGGGMGSGAAANKWFM